jgi:3-oxoacyl-(acyl-carrier-protein) synthase
MSRRRVVITGMSINTPIGDRLDVFLENLLAGRSAVTRWQGIDTSRIYAKVGADLSAYDADAKLRTLEPALPADLFKRLRRLVSRAPWSTALSMLSAADGFADSGLVSPGVSPDADRVAVIVGGHNLNQGHQFENRTRFDDEPDFMDGLFALTGLDTDHAGSVSEALGSRGPLYTIGAACASANTALRCGVDEIRHHDMDAAVIVGAVLEFSAMELHAMALMGAITATSFNDTPAIASRPYDTRREGFVPAHGGGTLVIEELDHARARGARIYAEVVGVEANSDACHLPQPSEDGQARLITRLLDRCGLAPDRIDYVNAHATSTPLGDITEVRSLKRVFGDHARKLKINATKSMLGHTCWSAPVVETVATVLQMRAGRLHPSINIDSIDPEIDLDVCAGESQAHQIEYALKNSFGFGGINCVSVLKRWHGEA